MSKDQNKTPKKRGRPTKDPRIPVNIRIPSRLLAALKEDAARNDRSAASIIVEFLHQRYPQDE